ncbi:MAG: hypothetical protein A2Y97_12895 [Nitrospirae bacterium RBG_13_39_12]|nr:MAG: hypothetical protein A2Y97_12895 [Nitrospirae bacterium RBG_13_39_12]
MKRNILILLYLLLCSILFVFLGCATTTTGGDAGQPLEQPQEATLITGIDIQDYTVTITANKPFTYTLYRPGDPYKIIIDLPDVELGSFINKIVSNKGGITEIDPSQVESPSYLARLEVLIQTPSIVEQEYKDNVLTVKIKEEPPKEVPMVKEKIYEPVPVAVEEKPLPKATEISSISFEKYADTVNILIKGNGSMIPNVLPLGDRIVLDIPDVIMSTPVPNTIVSPVTGIRAGKYLDKVRLVIDLQEKTNFDVTSNRDSIVVALQRLDSEPASASASAQKSEERAEIITGDEESKEPEMLVAGRCGEYLEGKENINLDFQDQDIVPILRLFANISGCNMFIHPDVKGKCTMQFKNVPWNQALDTILKSFSLGKSVEGNIIRIAPHTIFARESDEKSKAMEAEIKAEPLETRIYPISYADVKEVETTIKQSKLLSEKGNTSVDDRTSSLIVNDVPSALTEIENLLPTLDKATAQVMIEARIVEVNTRRESEFGIQWGVNFSATNTLSSIGGFSGLGTGPFTGGNYLVDVPAVVGPGSGSGITFGILNPSKTLGLDMQLAAIQTIGEGKVISNPRILTLNKEEAKILQGKSIPVRKIDVTSGQISTEYKDVTIEMKVEPHIRPDESISMKIEIKKEELDPTVPSVEGVPGTDKKEAITNVLIKNGETIVIGGLYKVMTDDSQTGVPGLMNVPFLGWLFKKDKETTTTNELLIFITPRIVERY